MADVTGSGAATAAVWLRVDRQRPASLSAQIVDQLRERIVTGLLRGGDRLPSSRALAATMGVARSVVVRAYEQLLGEGYVEARPGAETTVATGIVALPRAVHARPRAARMLSSERPGAIGRPIDLRAGHPYAPPAVPDEWRRAVVVASRRAPVSHAPSPLGHGELREQIALHARRSRGIPCAAEDVIVTAGTVDGLLLIALALGGRSRVAMEDPGYREAARVLRRAGASVTPLPVGADGITASQLRGAGPQDAVLVTPSHQFPLGGRMPAAERTAMVNWATDGGALIIEDDYDSEFRHSGAALPAIAALDSEGVVVHLGSLNKSFLPEVRCGYLIARAGSPVWQRITVAKQDVGSTVPLVVQVAAAAFFASGGFRRYVARVRREYRHRLTLLLGHFAERGLADRLSATDGGLHAVLRLPAGLSGTSLVVELAGRGVLVNSIAEFAQLPRTDDAIAIGYGAEPATRLVRGVDEVLRALLRR
jgi:GntR family transcriptional regulator/MocR family aminotransferase